MKSIQVSEHSDSVPLNRMVSSYFESFSDVFCYLDIQVDQTKHVKPIEVKPSQAAAAPSEGIFSADKFVTLTKYSFYESGSKYVKVLLDLKNIKTHDPAKIKIEFAKRSFSVKIFDFNGKNYQFAVPKL